MGIFQQGRESFRPDLNVYDANPYKQTEDRSGKIIAFQPEATPFFNGWQVAKKEYLKTDNYALFLDDFRFPNWINYINYPESTIFIIARHFYDFVDIIEEDGMPDFISWDFDLDLHGLDMSHVPYKTGLDCMIWLDEYCKKNNFKFPAGAVHSQSPTGAPQLVEFLNNIK